MTDTKDQLKEVSEIEKQSVKKFESMSDEEIIAENLKEILEKKSREERKANGRLVAVIVAFLVIFVAVYHAWIRNAAGLAGVLVPAIIMVSYGGWVVILAKRDKQRRVMFEKHLEEVALKNKADLEQKTKAKHKRPSSDQGSETKLYFENEIGPRDKQQRDVSGKVVGGSGGSGGEPRKHRKHHRHRRSEYSDYASGSCSSSSSSSRHSSSHHATKDLRSKRPSIRQKLFRQNATITAIAAAHAPIEVRAALMTQAKRPRLQRLDALSGPQLVRMSSVP